MMKQLAPRRIVDVNVLPKEHRPPQIAAPAAALWLGIALAVVGMLPLAMVAGEARDTASRTERQADEAEAQLRTLQVDLARHRALRVQLATQQAETEQLEEERASLQGGRRSLAEDLAQVWGWGYLSPSARITKLGSTVDGFRIEGSAPGPLEVIAYAEALASRGGFASARTTNFAPGPQGGVFAVEVTR